MIVGIDEVGRGAWAGPLVVGAVLLGGTSIEGLTDSKKLTKRQREVLDRQIRQKAHAIGLGWVSAAMIDRIGLGPALRVAAQRALSHIRHDYEEIIIDGTIRLIDDTRVTLMKKADLLVPSVSAASIVAKVARDGYMGHLDTVFKGYKFARHVGYGTAVHREMLIKNGVAPIHRKSFAPVAALLGDEVDSVQLSSSHAALGSGAIAEELVAQHLIVCGHTILERNWRTRYCEIDIISRYGQTIYFTEVKYRKNAVFGDPLAAITSTKQRQMRFAANMFLGRQKKNSLAQLLAAGVEGTPPRITEIIDVL